MPMTTLTIQEVNNIISEHFIKIFGNVVEHYPAAAIGILKNRPFQNSNDISVAINNFLDKLEMKGKFIKLFYKNCIDKYMFTESILHYVLKKSTLEGLITVSCVIIAKMNVYVPRLLIHVHKIIISLSNMYLLFRARNLNQHFLDIC
jgi:hypothetical protein